MSLEKETRRRLLIGIGSPDDARRAVAALDAWEQRWRRIQHFFDTNKPLLGCTCDDCETTRTELGDGLTCSECNAPLPMHRAFFCKACDPDGNEASPHDDN